MAAINLSMPETLKGITLDFVVTGLREASIRLWIGAQLLKLAARIMGCGIEVGAEPTDADVIRYQPTEGGPEKVVFGRRIRVPFDTRRPVHQATAKLNSEPKGSVIRPET